jgi:hypothetical protein
VVEAVDLVLYQPHVEGLLLYEEDVEGLLLDQPLTYSGLLLYLPLIY